MKHRVGYHVADSLEEETEAEAKAKTEVEAKLAKGKEKIEPKEKTL